MAIRHPPVSRVPVPQNPEPRALRKQLHSYCSLDSSNTTYTYFWISLHRYSPPERRPAQLLSTALFSATQGNLHAKSLYIAILSCLRHFLHCHSLSFSPSPSPFLRRERPSATDTPNSAVEVMGMSLSLPVRRNHTGILLMLTLTSSTRFVQLLAGPIGTGPRPGDRSDVPDESGSSWATSPKPYE
jgi:hypothetical protein